MTFLPPGVDILAKNHAFFFDTFCSADKLPSLLSTPFTNMMMTLLLLLFFFLLSALASTLYTLLFLLLVCLAHTPYLKSPLQLSNNSSYLFDAIYVSRTFLRTHTQLSPFSNVAQVSI